MPETLRGATDQETIDKLLAAQSALPKAPATADEYAFTPSEEFVKTHGDLKDDPALAIGRQVAHKMGLGPQQFQTLVETFYGQMNEAGLLQPPIDASAEIAKLMPKDGDGITKKSAALKRITGVHGWVEGLRAAGNITQTEANNLVALTVVADGVTVLEKLMSKWGSTGVVGGAGGGLNGASDASTTEKRLQSLYPSMMQ